MWQRIRGVASDAARDLAAAWQSLVLTDLAYKVLAFAVLTPLTALLLRWLLSRTGSAVVADTDIVRYVLTTRAGVLTLLVGGAVIFAITALELGCLMTVGLTRSRGGALSARKAIAFAGARAGNIVRLTGHMVVRLIVGVLPFLAAIGAVYYGLLHGHDINFFLARKPPAFWVAITLAALIGVAFVALLLRTVARWAFALPLLLFEGVHPRRALGAAAARSHGHRRLIVAVLAGWAVVAIALGSGAKWAVEAIGRGVAPAVAGSLASLILFLALLVFLWVALGIAVAIFNTSLLALLTVRLYLHAGGEDAARAAEAASALADGGPRKLGRRAALVVASVVALAAVGISLLAFVVTRGNEPVLVIAHRGSSATAPENTLAAFRLGVAEKADFIELDVQESLDGEVVVVHDSDLMKIGGSPMKIWEHTAAELRTVDIGSHKGAQFKDERVATLAEALAVAKGGTTGVLVELKSYGHNDRLEERVAEIVEAAGMESSCTFMSMDHYQVGRLKRLRPQWKVGVLVAKAFGDVTSLEADFVAVEARMATARFVRRAHRAKQQVYVWTVNDPAWMLAAMSHGVDGLITDTPAVARQVISRRAEASDAQRLLVALLVRAGARTEALEREDALRP